MGRGALPVLSSVPVCILAGMLLGFLSGLGVGGGSLLILWLTLALDTEPLIARAINLMFFITAAGSVCLLRWRRGRLQLRAILPAMLTGCLMAGLFSWVSASIDLALARKGFGILLLMTGVRELLYRPRKDR